MSDLETKIQEIVAEHLGKNREKISLEKRFKEDLGADSLDAVSIMVAIEDAFHFEMSDAEARSAKTVGDVVSLVKLKMNTN